MTTRTIYISGPMTGLPELNFPAFHEAAQALQKAGFNVINPARIDPGVPNPQWHHYMRADIRALCDCDAMALLPGWMNSKGAHLEVHLAHRLELQIGTVDEWLAMPAQSPMPALI